MVASECGSLEGCHKFIELVTSVIHSQTYLIIPHTSTHILVIVINMSYVFKGLKACEIIISGRSKFETHLSVDTRPRIRNTRLAQIFLIICKSHFRQCSIAQFAQEAISWCLWHPVPCILSFDIFDNAHCPMCLCSRIVEPAGLRYS